MFAQMTGPKLLPLFILYYPPDQQCCLIINFLLAETQSMAKDSEEDSSFELACESGDDGRVRNDTRPREGQQNAPIQGLSNAYDINYSVHGTILAPNKFPLHSYLKEHYGRLSLQEQIKLFKNYFCNSIIADQSIFEPAHIQILNQGLNLFTKVPENPMMFLSLADCGLNNEIITLKNYRGEIIHFHISSKNRKRSSVIIQIKRKVKGRPHLIIKDSSSYETNCFNKNTLFKLATKMKFLYIRFVSNQNERKYIEKQFFSSLPSKGRGLLKGLEGVSIRLRLDADHTHFYASSDEGDNLCESDLQQIEQNLLHHFQTIQKQEMSLVQADTAACFLGFRLRIFDTLYINFIKATSKGKQQFIQIIDKMSLKYACNLENVQEFDHFPESILTSRRCKHCQVMGRHKNKKSKYKCIACSKNFQVDIPLCMGCWSDFHEFVLPICRSAAAKDMKKIYEARTHRNFSRSQSESETKKSSKSRYSKNEEIKKSIVKLDQNMTEIERLMEQLEAESLTGIKIVKKFNEVLLLNIIDSFNIIMSSVLDERRLAPNEHTLSELEVHSGPGKPPE